MVPVEVGGIYVVLDNEAKAIEAIRHISEAFDMVGPFNIANNHAPNGENCSCGLKDYEHAWWEGWDAGDTEGAKSALNRRVDIIKNLIDSLNLSVYNVESGGN